ncbi:fimbrial biogenesis outer membrane usher protein [Burkholderia multivorans]|uniref:fimbria/pilus outer membrane usher protein n=1 Tax=Burkholderia multivorans TaxID=87883 RepID=UPI000DAEAE7F|nr:fimbria/pilus outer membrane usher protein [Burkholderia multivorans]MBR7898084.1 fimbrial biogenesis outer membrane usher protein [Burkholderia multivorans]RAA19642.1 fimbrial biogenesis outer membrane usher protein [Burkholderia multivorans]RAA30396.1 fimbrial biogenesis outer membrane usher protein [Burkholderia multivorans]RAA35665.1 fimbrial biogenesis outer membrane usher protein [Burkholderia multivorans]RAA37064.1 fimbrial biogenesis outer membrane usher protein [Burkholderia multiv
MLVVGSQSHATEFNSSFLSIDGTTDVDLSQFSQADFTLPGEYMLEVQVNDLFYGLQPIEFVALDASGAGKPCLRAELVAQFGLKPSLAKDLPRFHGGRCVDLAAIEGVTVRYLKGDGRLRITIPQAALEFTDGTYLPPERWSDGIAGAMLDYRVIANTNRSFGSGGRQTNAVQAYGTIGANWGAWRVRGDYQAQSNVGNTVYADRTFRFSRLYAFRALPSIQSTVTFGDDYLSSDIFDTFALTGASIRSDDRMLPPSLRGYAPLISGVARTNATVTVSQQGRVLYVTRVSPGAFALQNINTSVQGTLDVAVEEEDGSVQRFQVTTAAVPFLARTGQFRYKAAVGKPRRFGGAGITPFFGFGEAAYGLPFDVTVYGGFIAASGYTSIALGVGRDFGTFGAVSADVTHARARLWWNGATRHGNSYRINYSKHFDGLDADVRFFGYRFSERDYTNFAQFSGDPTAYGLANSKQRYSATMSKRFGDTSAYFSYDQTTYWERASEQRVGVTLTRAFSVGALRNLNVSVSAFRTQSAGAGGNQVSVTATLPIGGRHTVTSNLTTGNGSTSVNAGYLYDDPAGRTYQISAGATDGRASANASFRQRTSAYQLTAQASTVANGYAAASLEVDGSLVATQYGIAAHANGNAGDTRLLVSTDGVRDVPLSGTLTHTDSRGYAVLDGISPYNVYDAAVNVEKLPLEVQVSNPIQRMVLTDGAIGFVQFSAARGSNLYLTLTDAAGKPLPFGASVQDAANGKELGIVGEGGAAYLTQVQPKSSLVVRAGERTLCTIGTLPNRLQLEGTPIPVACDMSGAPHAAAAQPETIH